MVAQIDVNVCVYLHRRMMCMQQGGSLFAVDDTIVVDESSDAYIWAVRMSVHISTHQISTDLCKSLQISKHLCRRTCSQLMTQLSLMNQVRPTLNQRSLSFQQRLETRMLVRLSKSSMTGCLLTVKRETTWLGMV